MPGHLLTASVLSAPAALLISKVMLPETEKSETAGAATTAVPRTTANSIDALCRGAGDGMMLSINVIAMLIAFIAVVAMANFLISYALGGAGIHTDKRCKLFSAGPTRRLPGSWECRRMIVTPSDKFSATASC